MKHYKNENNEVFGFNEKQEVPIGLVEITKEEADQLGLLNSIKKRDEENAKIGYAQQRVFAYPPLSDFADAWVKGDNAALEAYRQECLAVKAKYPKPAGF